MCLFFSPSSYLSTLLPLYFFPFLPIKRFPHLLPPLLPLLFLHCPSPSLTLCPFFSLSTSSNTYCLFFLFLLPHRSLFLAISLSPPLLSLSFISFLPLITWILPAAGLPQASEAYLQLWEVSGGGLTFPAIPSLPLLHPVQASSSEHIQNFHCSTQSPAHLLGSC